MFTIKPPKLNFDNSEADRNQNTLVEKAKAFKITTQANYKKDILGIKKVANNDKTVKPEFVRDVLAREPKYRSLAASSSASSKVVASTDALAFASAVGSEPLYSAKLAELELELQKELQATSLRHSPEAAPLDADSIVDLQGTKGLAKYDCWDEDLRPEDWALLCSRDPAASHAKCPVFRDNRYVWVDVKVLSYDAQKARFQVQVFDGRGAFEKSVSRLSIYFLKEDLAKFRQRIAQCKMYQLKSDEEIRFIRLTESVPNELVRPLPAFFVSAIQKKVNGGRRRGGDFAADQATLSSTMKIIHAEYLREMKHSYILDQMQDPSKAESFASKGIQLRREQTQRFEYSTLALPPAKSGEGFKERLGQLRQRVFFRNPKMVEALRLFQEKSHDFQRTCLFDLGAFEKKHAFALADFVAVQREHLERNKESLRIQWREYLLGDICDILRNIQPFNAAMNDLADYRRAARPSLERFLNRIDLSFRFYLSRFFKANCGYYKSFLQRFVLPAEGAPGAWVVSDKPLLKVTMKFAEADKRRRDKGARAKDDKLIYFEPSFEDFQRELTEPVRWLAAFVGSVECLEADITRMLGIPSYRLLSVDEQSLEAACEEVTEMLASAFAEPNQLLAAFQPFEFLLERSKEEIIRSYFENIRKMGSFSMVDEYLEKVSQSVLEINSLCAHEHKTVMFQVRAAELKEQLAQRAVEIKRGILKKMSNEVNRNVESIRASYQELQAQMVRQPEREEDLVQLNRVIAACEERLAELELKTDETYKYITMMEKHGERFDENSMVSFWLLKVCPVDVRASQAEGKKIAAAQEQAFLARLDEDKRNLEIDISSYKLSCDELRRLADYKALAESAKRSDELGRKLDEARKRLADFNRREALFEIVPCRYESLDKLLEEFAPYRELWDTAFTFDSTRETWLTSQVAKVSHKRIGADVEKHKKSLSALVKKFEEEGNSAALAVCAALRDDIRDFETSMPFIDYLTRDCLAKKPSNWKALFQALHIHSNQQTDTLAQLLNSGVLDQLERIEDIVGRMEKEYTLETKLQREVVDRQKAVRVELLPHKASGSFMLGQVDELQTVLDELLNTVLLMKQSPYLGGLRKKTEEIEKKLMDVQDLLGEWLKCQRTWVYLNPIFASEDLKKKMPVEKKLFDGVDAIWQQLMRTVAADPFLFDKFECEKALGDLQSNNRVLDQVQKSLSDYLEAKRDEFPRFYFLSDEELIEIISKTKDPTLITKYLGKCFEGIDSIEFAPDAETIVSFASAEKEVLALRKPVNVNEGEKRGNVEKWLLELEEGMREAVKGSCREAHAALSKLSRPEWLRRWPGQVVLAVNAVRWTAGVEEAIVGGSLAEFERQAAKELAHVVELVRQDLPALDRLTLSALIVLEVHAKYVVAELVRKGISQTTDFEWLSQLRYSLTERGGLRAAIMTAEYDYQYEYLGNTPRLVITPLTDRCYRTLMSAFQFFYGGAPEGPAGTGKTETVKDLAKAVAVQCNVFNCTDQINYVAMSKFFKGLSQTGAWCCFDEFNRIETEVLSVIAEQVRTIQTAVKEGRNKFFFEGKNMRLVRSCAINITMNPGYAGRSELPDNLKSLFRACAMMIPDYSLIAEISLYSNGFQTADSLATKVVAALRLSSEQLSSQKHYDFGMRALKAILVAAGTLKKKDPEADEASLCLKALKDVNLPKFTPDDVPLFNAIISDLFPGVQQPPRDHSALLTALGDAARTLGLLPADSFLLKALQLFDTIQVRHGLMLVGETFAGKSSVLQALQGALRALGRPTERFVLNPKAVTGLQLYGSLDQNTKIWTDGIVPAVMKVCEEEGDKAELKWVCFDGPVDAVWIENMNTVLDDNKVLCLTNGQKIRLTQWTTVMFEVEDLLNASPATVSRAGIVYLEPDQLGWQTLLDAYVGRLPEGLAVCAEAVRFNLEWLLAAVLAYVDRFAKLPLKVNKLQLTANSLAVFSMLLREFEQTYSYAANLKDFEGKLQDLCLYAVIWGVGGVVDELGRQEANIFLLKLVYFEDVRKTYDLEIDSKAWAPRGLNLQIKDLKNLFSMRFDVEKLAWAEWSAGRFDFGKDRSLRFDELIVPTAESQRTGYFIRAALAGQGNVLLVGPTGTGKTLGVLSELRERFSSKEVGSLCTSFSGQTHPNAVQRQIEGKMGTRKGRKGHFGPDDNKRQLVVFIDDVNLPAKETFGAQPPIELLRMMLDSHFWYDLETLEPRHLQGLNFAAAMGPPSSGRNAVTSRFLRHFFLAYLCPFDSQSLQAIFGAVLEYQFSCASPRFLPSVVALKDVVVRSTLELFQRIRVAKELLPTPQKSHYTFSVRDVARVFQSFGKATFRTFRSEEDMVRLWVHECTRVVSDRLVSLDDQAVFAAIVRNIVKGNFKQEWSKLVKAEPILFADFVPINVLDKEGNQRQVSGVYTELSDRAALRAAFQRTLAEYNEANPSNRLNLVLFTEAVEHVVRIHRVLTTPAGHCLLVGLGGLGRKTLATLAAFIAGFDCKSLEMTPTFGPKEWSESLQEVLREAGCQNRKTAFLLKDIQVSNENMLEDVSALLNRGEVPGLFPPEERARVIDEIGGGDPAAGTTPSERFEFFLKRCRDNLHLCLSFSPANRDFRRRLRTFPALINCTTVDWFLDWPKEAFHAVAEHLVKEAALTASETTSVCAVMVAMHETTGRLSGRFLSELKRHYYVTPTNFLELNGLFLRVLRTRTAETNANVARYEKGVATLTESKTRVEEMKQTIIELEPRLKVANQETEQLIRTVESEKQEADLKKSACEEEERLCNKNREEAQALKAYCREELDKVEPMLEAASKNLKTIQRAHIDFIKTLKILLPPILKLFQSLCIFFGVTNVPLVKDPANPYKKKPDWATPARNVVMAKPDAMLSQMLATDAEAINRLPVSVISQLKELQKDPQFDIEAIDNVSQAAGKIAVFINTVVEIYDKLQIINPKREALREAELKLEQAERSLQATKDELAALMQKLDRLEAQLGEARQRKEGLENELQRCKRQLVSAEKLVSGLETEKVNWLRNIAELKANKQTILSDVLLSSGVIAYLGVFPVDYREAALAQWTEAIGAEGLPLSPVFELRSVLSNDILINDWTSKSRLPNDSYSIDNAVIISNATRYPLIIDPQSQANRWIRLKEKDSHLVVLKPSLRPADVQNEIVAAMESGFPVLFENADEHLDWAVLAVFENRRKKVGRGVQLKFLDRWVDVGEGFRFYVTTKLSKPHFAPDVCALVSMLNFQVTPLGLEDQLLNLLVSKEDPNSEKARINNVRDFYELRRKQKATEDHILSLLMSSEGSILDNVTLIDALQKSKTETKDAVARLADIEAMKKKLTATRNFYRKAANRASHLFFCVNDLGLLEPMYQFSLDWFIELFSAAVSEEPKVKETRVDDIVAIFVKTLFARVAPSLFEKDKLLFAFLIYLKMLVRDEAASEAQVRKLFVGCSALRPKEEGFKVDFLSDKQLAHIEELADSFPAFCSVLETMVANERLFRTLMADADPQLVSLPPALSGTLNEVEQLMLFKVLRPDKFRLFVQQKVLRRFGPEFVDYQSFSLEAIFKDSRSSTPIIFILSPGSDPLNDIIKLSIQLGKAKSVDVLSLGQGQEAAAQKFLETAQAKGRWVVLQNCHLAPRILGQIEKAFDEAQNADFRLWLTSMPSDRFPVSLLQTGIKVTNEAPRGIKANLARNFSLFGQKYLDHPKGEEWKRLLFSLTLFHSVVQERRKFGALGWNVPYEFSQTDLVISAAQLNSMLREFSECPWRTVHYAIAEANYGGRVTDPQDRRLINVILADFLGPQVLGAGCRYSGSERYACPPDSDMAGYLAFVRDSFPLNDAPDIFGMHPNAEITSGINQTNELLASLVSLLPRTGGAEGQTSDQLVSALIAKITSQVPRPFDLEAVQRAFPALYENSMNSVLVQEVVKYNRLNDKLTSSLGQLQKAIEGLVMMSEELDEIYTKLLSNKVPDSWHAQAYASCKPLLSWVANLCARLQFIDGWVREGQPASFWISGFFFTQSFLTGILQNHARRTKIPVDSIGFEYAFLDAPPSAPADVGAFVHGLKIEGAALSESPVRLEDSRPKVLFTEVPSLWLRPVRLADKQSAHSYRCPVYKTSRRAGTLSTTGHSTNYVISVDVPMDPRDSEEKWIKRGVAMLCELDE